MNSYAHVDEKSRKGKVIVSREKKKGHRKVNNIDPSKPSYWRNNAKIQTSPNIGEDKIFWKCKLKWETRVIKVIKVIKIMKITKYLYLPIITHNYL